MHALPSLQAAVLFEWVHPVVVLHTSLVQTFPSSQLSAGPPTHVPLLQVSPEVQAFASLHVAALFVCVHPVAGLQASSVHTLPSLQLGAAPPTQTLPLQASAVVHAFPSSQSAVLSVCVQPLAGLQASFVQGLPSSQLGAGPPTH